MRRVVVLMVLLISFLFSSAQYDRISIKEKDTFVCVHNLWIHIDSVVVTPFDSLDLVNQQITNNDFAFLINDSTYYDCKVLKISKLSEGYTIRFGLKIGWRDVYAQVVTTNEKNKHFKKIKVGNTYKMKLKRYFNYPLHRAIEYPLIYDVMLGKTINGVLSTGLFCYLFVSPNLDGLYYIDSNNIDKMGKEIELEKKYIQDFVYRFVNTITFKKDSTNLSYFIDSTLIVKSLRKHRQYLNNRGYDFNIYKIPKQVPFRKWALDKIDTSNFTSFFWGILKVDYQLPIYIDSCLNYEINKNDILIDILYYKYPLYTVRVKWNNPIKKINYIVIVTIKEDDYKFKIIGFNQKRR
ncbi:MAG: hypothetical protein PHI52_01495 [Bacteroidales bacterium]|nr:hypothetical protein [Bacteroidales bacterium]